MSLFPTGPRTGGNWRRAQGRAANVAGGAFETSFHARACFQGFEVTRIPNGCRRLRGELIQIKSPFDWAISKDSKSAFIDTKTSDGKVFPHSKIDLNQVYALIGHEKRGSKAGYVIQLCEANVVCFVPSSILLARGTSGGKGSISPTCPGVIVLGTCAEFDVGKIWK